jgi:hypothetical protein
MSRREEIKRKRAMMTEWMKGKKVESKKKKKASKKKKEIDADVNDDGKIDEKDVEEVRKRIVKKKS